MNKNYLIILFVLCIQVVFAQQDTVGTKELTKILSKIGAKDTSVSFGNGVDYSSIKEQAKLDTTSSQQKQVYTLAQAFKDSVVLRWAPSDRATWLLANKKGYVVYRIDMEAETEKEINGPQNPRLPYDSTKWKKLNPIHDNYAILAAAAVTGDLELTNTTGFVDKMKQENGLFGFTMMAADHSALAAEGLGLRYVDKDVKVGKTYLYLVQISDTTLKNITPYPTSVEFTGTYTKPTITDVQAYSLEEAVLLTWDVEQNLGFSSYYIERSTDGGITYDSLTKLPYISTVDERLKIKEEERNIFLDTLAENGVEYTYRITGNTPFATQSQPFIIKGTGRDLTPPKNPIIKSGKETINGMIYITWEIPEVAKDFKEVNVLHASSLEGEYKKINTNPLTAKDTSFLYTPNRDSVSSNYFKIQAVDQNGNESQSFGLFVDLLDSIPPAIPIGLKGVVDSTGLVTLTWKANTENDLEGYRVYFANDKKREFTQLTSSPIMENKFEHTIKLNTLTEDIYFKIQASDFRHNHSEFTEILKVAKPDTIRPITPVMHTVKATDKNILISWEPSTSADVVAHFLYRRKTGEKEYKLVIELQKIEITKYEDWNAEKGQIYEYAVQAKDDADLLSEMAFPVKGRVYDQKIRPKVESIEADFEKEDNQVKLSWKYDASGDYRFVILRGKDKGSLYTYKSLKGTERKFVDAKIKKDGKYRYAIKVIYKGGAKSLLSKEVDVNVKLAKDEE